MAKRWEHTKASLRAKVEHPFRVIKRQFGYVKVRYRSLVKNTAQMLTLFALSNLWLKRKELMPAAGKVCLSPGKYTEKRAGNGKKIRGLSALSAADVACFIVRPR